MGDFMIFITAKFPVRLPKIVNFSVPQDDWSELGEMAATG
jgi:hypothetical protein